MLPTRQQSAAPACSGRCGAAASPPRPVHGADERRHGLPPAAGSAHFPKEAQDAPAVYAALCSAAHGPRHTKPTLSLAKRLSAEGLAARTRLLRGHALRPGERGAGTQPFLESCVPEGRFFYLILPPLLPPTQKSLVSNGQRGVPYEFLWWPQAAGAPQTRLSPSC